MPTALRGRLRKGDAEKRTAYLNMRAIPWIRAQLEAAAVRNDRSLAAEVAARLEWSLGRYWGDGRKPPVNEDSGNGWRKP